MLFCKLIMHLMGLCELFPPFVYCTFEGLCFMRTITHFRLLFRTNLVFDLWFKPQVFLILLFFSSFHERDKSVMFVTGCLLFLPFEPTSTHWWVGGFFI